MKIFLRGAALTPLRGSELFLPRFSSRRRDAGRSAEARSPSLRAAINGGYCFLRVQCSGCKQRAYIDLEQVKRRPGTPIWTLKESLARNRRAPLAPLERLTREKRG